MPICGLRPSARSSTSPSPIPAGTISNLCCGGASSSDAVHGAVGKWSSERPTVFAAEGPAWIDGLERDRHEALMSLAASKPLLALDLRTPCTASMMTRRRSKGSRSCSGDRRRAGPRTEQRAAGHRSAWAGAPPSDGTSGSVGLRFPASSAL